MAKKSKDDWKKEGEELEKLFRAVKVKEHHVALVLCDEGIAIEADPRLPAENLFKTVKKRDGATTRGAIGTVRVSGIQVEFELTDPPSNLEQKLKQYFLQVGLKLKPVLVEKAEGAVPVAKEPAKAEAEPRPSTAAAADAGPDPAIRARGESRAKVSSGVSSIMERFKDLDLSRL